MAGITRGVKLHADYKQHIMFSEMTQFFVIGTPPSTKKYWSVYMTRFIRRKNIFSFSTYNLSHISTRVQRPILFLAAAEVRSTVTSGTAVVSVHIETLLGYVISFLDYWISMEVQRVETWHSYAFAGVFTGDGQIGAFSSDCIDIPAGVIYGSTYGNSDLIRQVVCHCVVIIDSVIFYTTWKLHSITGSTFSFGFRWTSVGGPTSCLYSSAVVSGTVKVTISPGRPHCPQTLGVFF